MLKQALLIAGFALLHAAQAADAPSKPPCENFPWPMTREVAAFAAAPQDTASGATLTAWPSGVIRLALKPYADAALPLPAGKPPADPSKASAGWVVLPAATAGTYEVTVAGKDWVDVIQDGKALPSVAHASDPSCTAFHKSVRFTLTAAPVTLQVSGEAADSVTFTIFPGQ